MGCSSSADASDSISAPGCANLVGLDLDKPSQRPVQDFDFYASRLKPIDYQAIIDAGEDWKDPNFPPESSSIVDQHMMKDSRMRRWENLEWRRPKDVYGEGGFKIYESPGPNDIKQGMAGDCYYLSCLASLAEFPERIKRIFITKEVNDAGIYACSFYVNGEKRTVVVDDYFPYDADKEVWAFSRPSLKTEIWVLILEKAWAKIFGSYQRIEAGTAGEAMYPLTGSPHKFFLHEDYQRKEYIWARILQADKMKCPMATAVASMADEDLTRTDVKNAGLVDAHAYSLIGAKVVEDDNGKKWRLIKIRNPWGKKEWQGAWSDKSSNWTPKTKAQVNFKNANDGTFWISFEDYVDFFYITTICFYSEKYEDTFVCDQHEFRKYGMVKFTNPKDHPTPLSFTIDQINSRFVDETMQGNYEYPGLRLILTSVKDGVQTFVDGSRENDTHVSFFKKSLPAGDYIILYQSEFQEGTTNTKLVISCYSDWGMNFKTVDDEAYPEEAYKSMTKALHKRVMERQND